MQERKTVRDIRELYEDDTPIAMVTCYDFTFAKLVDRAEMDAVLIGDSLGNVVQGQTTTLPVTLDDIVYHTRAVCRGTSRAHVIADMPFLSYQTSPRDGVEAAGRILKESEAQAVKVEGGREFAPTIDRIVDAGVPVVGHLGLTPQSVHQTGGYRVQGGDDESGEALLEDARALEEAGIYALVLEMVPASLAAEVTEVVDVPTIGIGAGPDTSGQVLVLHDLLGLDTSFTPKFLKRYAELEGDVVDAVESFGEEVREGEFPQDEHSF